MKKQKRLSIVKGNANDWLRLLHQNGEDISICALEKTHPEQLPSLFEGDNSLGWFGSLESLGIDPMEIPLEVEPQVTCLICGKTAASLATHLNRDHQVSAQEYREEFGEDAQVEAEDLRAWRSNYECKDFPHWSLVHSKWYVLDRIIQAHRRGIPTSMTHMNKLHRTLVTYGLKHFGTWSQALTEANIGFVKPTKTRWSKTLITKELKAVSRGERKMDTALCSATCRKFGSITKAMKQIGLTSNKRLRGNYSDEDKQELLEAVRSLQDLLGRERHERCKEIKKRHIKLIRGHFVTDSELALAAGVDPSVISTEVYRTQEDVEHDLTALLPLKSFTELFRIDRVLFDAVNKKGWCRDLIPPSRHRKKRS